MTLVETLVSALIAIGVAAAGAYLATKYTEQRRRQQKRKLENEQRRKLVLEFGPLLHELRDDIAGNPRVRAAFVKRRSEMVGALSEPHFCYFLDDHPQAREAFSALAQLGLVRTTNSQSFKFQPRLATWLSRM